MNRTPLDYFRDGLEAMQKAQEFVVFTPATRGSRTVQGFRGPVRSLPKKL